MSIARSLTSDTRTSYLLTVRATDKGTPSRSGEARVTVQISSRNIDCPQFDASSPSNVSVPVSARTNDPLFLVSATDNDTGRNGDVTYSILPGNGAQATFSIDPETGVLSNG